MANLENGKHASEGLAQFRQCFKDAGHTLRHEAQEKVSHVMDEVKHRSSDAKVFVTDYVREHPMKSVGWALLAGTILGFMLRR